MLKAKNRFVIRDPCRVSPGRGTFTIVFHNAGRIAYGCRT